MLNLDSYPGGKGGAGVYHTIINHIPPHNNYISPFLGGGFIFRRKLPAERSYLNDLDNQVFATWKEKGREVTENFELSETRLYSQNWREFLDILFTVNPSLDSKETFIFVDPPYPYLVRKSGDKSLYPTELSPNLKDDPGRHVELLSYLLTKFQKARVMICSYPNSLYEDYLNRWNSLEYQGQSRGPVKPTEKIWYNYEVSALHDYRYLGEDFRERERIGRKVKRQIEKFKNLPELERLAILSEIRQVYFS